MNILIVAATKLEVKLFVDELDFIKETPLVRKYSLGENEIDILITGIGATFTTFHLSNALREQSYQLVINIGIAGTLTADLAIGDVVSVITDEFADLGVEKEDEFLTLFDVGFMDSNEFPFENCVLKSTDLNDVFSLKRVKGITTNRSHGKLSSISDLKSKFSAQVETMEGAAVLYVCNWLGVQCVQIRAISNYVEPRSMSKWNIPLALEKLNLVMLDVLKKLAPVEI